MKTIVLFVFVFIVFPALGQNVDSLAAVQEVDSLIQVSRVLTEQQDFDKALDINIFAERIALEKSGRESTSFASSCFNHGRILYLRGDISNAEKWYQESRFHR